MNLFRNFNKHKYIRLITFKNDKSVSVRYFKSKEFERYCNESKGLLVDPNHMFIQRGFRTFITAENTAQTINPLDIKSQYDAIKFEIAIQNKVIRDTFNKFENKKFDLNTMLLIGILAALGILLYYQLMGV